MREQKLLRQRCAFGNRPENLPLGLITFKLNVAEGATVSVPILLSAPAPANARWYKHDTVNGWQEFTAYAVFSVDRKTVTLTLTDGGDGDADFTKNGIIIDPSERVEVAVTQPPAQGETTPAAGSSSGGGCFIDPLKQQ